MCKLGDIIVINKYIGDDSKEINKHSFIVINDQSSFIEGYRYDLVANVISSFKNETQKAKKLSFKENLEIMSDMVKSDLVKNSKSGFIKADQLFYFNKDKLDYYTLGSVSDELLDELLLLIMTLTDENKVKNNIENLKY